MKLFFCDRCGDILGLDLLPDAKRRRLVKHLEEVQHIPVVEGTEPPPEVVVPEGSA